MTHLLGKIFGSKFPKTEKYENEYNKLLEDFERFQKLEKSESILRYSELDTLVHSGDFEKKVRQIKTEKFRNTEAHAQYRKFKEYRRSKNVKHYNKYLKKNITEKAEELHKTNEIQKYLELKKFVESEEYIKIKSEITDRNRYKKSKEYQLQEEFKALAKSVDVLWYLKVKKSNRFHELNKWKLTFEDDFNATKLDDSVWITGYYWGKALLNDNYVQANEKQFFKHENIELRDSCARIISKNDNCHGKVWDPKFGFVPTDFEYSSGIISTGQSFRQKYGRFEAKIRYDHTTPAAHTFWLLAEQVTPQVNIMKSLEKGKNKIEAGNFSTNNDKGISQKTQKVSLPGSSSNFYIYSLEWSKNKLEWKINGVTVHVQNENIPQVPMYISLSTHFTENPNPDSLPISMDIDWVRCYQLS